MYDYRDYLYGGEPNRVRIIPGTIISHIIILLDIYVDLLASCNSIVPTDLGGQVFEFHADVAKMNCYVVKTYFSQSYVLLFLQY
jgi:hypothetical protein